MKNLKLLLAASIIGLASMATTAQAALLAPTSAGSQGTLSVIVDGAAFNYSGGIAENVDLDNTGSVFYDLVLDTVGHTSDGTNSTLQIDSMGGTMPVDTTVELFIDNGDNMFTAADTSLVIASSDVGSNVFAATITEYLSGLTLYFLQITTTEGAGYSGQISAVSTVPVPAAGILFASALFGAGALGRRKKKAANTAIVGAFARAA